MIDKPITQSTAKAKSELKILHKTLKEFINIAQYLDCTKYR